MFWDIERSFSRIEEDDLTFVTESTPHCSTYSYLYKTGSTIGLAIWEVRQPDLIIIDNDEEHEENETLGIHAVQPSEMDLF